MHRNFQLPARAILAAILAFLSGCLANAGFSAPAKIPEPFTGQLTEVDGVQAVISLRHPKLVNQDLEKLMAGIPEAALLRMQLSRLTAFGYPEFSDIAAGSNVGVAIVGLAGGNLKASSAVFIGFARLTEGGKLWTLLSQRNLSLRKHGGWVLIAKDEAAFGQLKSPEAVVAYLEKPQSEDLRVWVRTSPGFLSGVKEAVASHFTAKLAALPVVKQKAALAYLDAVFSILRQLHSVSVSLSFDDVGIKLGYSAQFLPDSPAGIFLRRGSGPAPAVAARVSADALVSFVTRQDPTAVRELLDSLFDTLIAVDYPPASERLRQFKATEDAFLAASDGGGAGVFELGLTQDFGRDRLAPRYFIVNSGHFGSDLVRDYFRQSQSLGDSLAKFMSPRPRAGVGQIEVHRAFTENAVTVDGIPFSSMAMTTTLNGKTISSTTQYSGEVDGDMVVADSEATLRSRLPALRAGAALAEGIRGPESADIMEEATVNGARLVDVLADAAKLDLKDPDVSAQLAGLKSAFAAGGPAIFVLTGGQAGASATVSIPYKFVTATIHLGEYMSARKANLLRLLSPVELPDAAANPLPRNPPSPYFDWRARYAGGKALAREGRPAEALAAYLWCYDNISQRVGMVGVPVSVISSIAELGATYPPALQALKDRSARALEKIKSRPFDRSALANFVAINRALGDDAASLAYFDKLPADSVTRTLLQRLLFTQLVQARRYSDALKAKPYEEYREDFDRYLRFSQSSAATPRLLRTQIAYIANLGECEAEALAGTGDLVHARDAAADVVEIDSSPKTLAALKARLDSAGHGELAPAPGSVPPAPAPAPARSSE